MSACYHICGHQLWQESQFNGLTQSPIFLDDDDCSPTCGQEVSDCPGCGDFIASENIVTGLLDREETISLTKDQILLALRKLRIQIETETGGLSGEQALFLIDICQALHFPLAEIDYVAGEVYELISIPIPVKTSPEMEASLL